jgi:hypothetical protein
MAKTKESKSKKDKKKKKEGAIVQEVNIKVANPNKSKSLKLYCTHTIDEVAQPRSSKILEYIRNSSGQKIGILFAHRYGTNTPIVYWSLCRKGDEFDLAEGLAQGLIRQHSLNGKDYPPLPTAVKKKLPDFVDRCGRFFKTDTVIVA